MEVTLNPTRLAIAAILGLIILLILIIKFHIQAMISILVGALVIGLTAGMPVANIIGAVNDGIGNTLKGIALLVGLGSMASVLLFQWIGYYLSSAIFIVTVMIAMGEKNKLQLILTPIIWCVFTYFVFDRLLFISLPIGSLFKGIL